MNFEVVVNETIECMQRLEQLHSKQESADFLRLKKLLDLPHITDDPHYLDWNPSKSRVKCFKLDLHYYSYCITCGLSCTGVGGC